MNKAYNRIIKQWLTDTLKTQPKDLSNYARALTHRSYSNENNLPYSYQELEFLGDSIISFLTADYLYHKYSNETEGFLTDKRIKMVQGKTLVQAAKQINLQNYILLGQGFKNQKDIDKILEDCFESLMAAIYLDLGLATCKKLLDKTLFMFEDVQGLNDVIDYKSKVQEALVKHNTKSAMYEIKQINANLFEATLKVDGIIYGKGSGRSKKQAQKAAAKEAYSKLVFTEEK